MIAPRSPAATAFDVRCRGLLPALLALALGLCLVVGPSAADGDSSRAGSSNGKTSKGSTVDNGSDPAAVALMRAVNQRPRGGHSRMRMHMKLEDDQRGDFEKTVLRLGHRLEDGYRTLYQILEPEHEEGIGLLLSEDVTPAVMWMYFPISDHLVRVASRGLSALASDFNCEDLLLRVPLSDYRLELLESGSENGVAYTDVRMTPATSRLQRELGFSHSIGRVRADPPMIVRAEYFDFSGQLYRTFEASDIEQVDGIWTARRTRMRNHRAAHATEVTLTEVQYGVDSAAEFFVAESLSERIGGADPPTAPAAAGARASSPSRKLPEPRGVPPRPDPRRPFHGRNP